MKKFLILFLLCAAPLSAQTIPPDFHQWFLSQVAGKEFSQQTLLDLEVVLPCVGSGLTPPNASGERTKIWEPNEHQWRRVGFGDHEPPDQPTWVWKATTPGPPPPPQPCGTAPLSPIPNQTNVFDLSGVYARLDSLTGSVAAITAQNERIFANETQQIQNLSDQLKAHDEKASAALAFLGDAGKFTAKYIAPALAAWYAGRKMTK